MIYIDDAQIPATVHGRLAAWSHLVAIPFNQAELLEFGMRLGMKAQWLQTRFDCDYTHFDVTQAIREKAIRLGATPITTRELVELVRTEKARLKRNG